ncbi:Spermidine/putrescine transport system permease protein PotB [Starkeya nomas]|uniref:Spermidine/putrescine transport system permease protein PotB n=2 Tax=Xanthobacteraceae TaxID=335928 RepID=A0A5S9PVJ9_9HYPH|nr:MULTISPECIES: ABC transporter permease [Xanthobacteraceae]TSJ64007.1 ABC transporter permease [Ancylobacter moscoviensis]CAA0108653.1 Spermidine/putrescine transport system permease protein PotB [Starkeya nomas]
MTVTDATTSTAPHAPSASSRRAARGFAPVTPALALVVFVFVLPVLALLLRSVLEPQPGLQNYEAFFASTTYLKVLGNTFLVAGTVTVVTVLLGFPVAWFLAIAPGFWSRLLFAIVILSMWTNLLARTYAWMVLLQRTGIINRTLIDLGLISGPLPLINNLVGVTIGMTYIMLPFMILPLHATIRSIDPTVFQAAALCGASRWQAFTRVMLPLTASGIAAGALMVFVMSLGYFITPALLGGTSNMMLAELIAQLVQSLLDWGLAGAAALILLTITLAIYLVQLRFFGFGQARS